VASEPDHRHHEDDETMPPVPATIGHPDVAELPSPMADLPTGTGFGTLVHAILETADTTATDLAAEVTARAREQLGPQPHLDPQLLADALLPAIRTPLGPLASNRRLADIPPHDRLSELDFELPLDGGDDAARGSRVTLAAVGRLMQRHIDPHDPLADYPQLLQGPALGTQRLRGYLGGSIDAILRVPAPQQTRYLVVDYKTNWLGNVGPTGPDPLTTVHYRPAALAHAMVAAHYPLQALLYCVALHRYLTWRQPGYRPAEHLGGVLYLFLRGMCGPHTPVVDGVPCGVFSWRPPHALIEELSVLLDGGTP
jgi:exodeoxyribonuclease V beta subunit